MGQRGREQRLLADPLMAREAGPKMRSARNRVRSSTGPRREEGGQDADIRCLSAGSQSCQSRRFGEDEKGNERIDQEPQRLRWTGLSPVGRTPRGHAQAVASRDAILDDEAATSAASDGMQDVQRPSSGARAMDQRLSGRCVRLSSSSAGQPHRAPR